MKMMTTALAVDDVDLNSFLSFLVVEQSIFDAFVTVPEVTRVAFAEFYEPIMRFWHWQVNLS